MLKNTVILIVLFLLSFFLFTTISKKPANNKSQAIINNQTINLEIADTDAKREKGLSDRPSLPSDSGMLFIFTQKGIYSFWMKKMQFPLDFVWIDDTTVVDMTLNAPPEGDNPTKIYSSVKPVNKVLEINASLAHKLEIKIGDRIEFKNIP